MESDSQMPLVTDEASLPSDPLNRMDPRALVNLLPGSLSEALFSLASKDPGLIGKDEQSLWKELRAREEMPTATANRLRLKFWQEYDRVQVEGGKMQLQRIVAGVCFPHQLMAWVKSPEFTSWLACPPAGYLVKMEEALEFGLEQMRDILAIDHMAGGKPNVKLMELKAKIVDSMQLRVKGAVVQKTVNLNSTVPAQHPSVTKAIQAVGADDVEKRLKELERRDRMAKKWDEAKKQVSKSANSEVLDAEVVK
jgi:hypothetical protein